MKIFIIGATGFIGRHLVEELNDDHELILLHRGRIKDGFVKDHQSVISDRSHLPELRPTLEPIRPDIVIDLIPYFAQHAWDVVNTFRNLTSHVIALSSGDVYRAYEIFKDRLEVLQEQPLTESSDLRQKLFPYRGTHPEDYLLEHYEKILVESILRTQKEFNYTILRLGAVYGPYDSQHKLKEYIRPLLKDEKMIIDQTKAQWKWTRIYVREVARAIKTVLENLNSCVNQVYNVGELHTLSQFELIQRIKSLTAAKKKVEVRPDFSDEPFNYHQHITLDSSKFRRVTQYAEKYDLDKGLLETIEWEESRQDS